MTAKSRKMIVGMMLVLFVCGVVFISPASSQDLRRSHVVLMASDVLPKELLVGPNYKIKDGVLNDGLVNTYELDTLYGPFKVESTALLLKRIAELRALVKIEELKGTDVYLKAFKQAATSPLKTAEGAILDPVGTVTGVVSGIGRFFTNISSSITSNGPYKESVLNSVLGQASYKREFAHQFGVDPYTSYEPLQKALNDLAWTAAAGGLTVKTALAAIPGAAVAVVSYAGTAGSLKALVNEKPPNELTKINQGKLWDMGVPDYLVEVFVQNTYYDPYEQTLLVGMLESMTGVTDRKIFIETATGANEEAVAVFLRVRAQLMGLYQEKTKSVERFVNANGVPFLLTKSGKIVGIFPLDYISWNSAFAQKETAVSDAIQKMPGITGKELLITGLVSPAARKALEARGWKVEDKFEDQIMSKLGY